jgi:L-lactate permease
MKKTQAKMLAVIGGSAFVALGALGVAVGAQPDSNAINSSEMSTGVTITDEAVAPSAPETSVAAPAIKGPAPLPPEEQGLPG